MPRSPIVTIDGPSGSGKGTISRAVAVRVGWHLLDSGALYRLVALAGLKQGAKSDDVEAHARIAGSMDVRFDVAVDGGELVVLSGEEVTRQIRSEEAGQGASRVAAWPPVRAALLDRQRAFAKAPGLVADGRDMGTVVFPNAALKIFLIADPWERARRRLVQSLSRRPTDAEIAEETDALVRRDARDAMQTVQAKDAILIDTTTLTQSEQVARIVALAEAAIDRLGS